MPQTDAPAPDLPANQRSARWANTQWTQQFYIVLGKRIKSHRTGAKVGAAQLANYLGVYPCVVSNIEAGRQRVTADQLYRIASALDVPIAELMGARHPDVRGRD